MAWKLSSLFKGASPAAGGDQFHSSQGSDHAEASVKESGSAGAGFKSTSGMDDEPRGNAVHGAHQGGEHAGFVSQTRPFGDGYTATDPDLNSLKGGGAPGDAERHAGPGAAHVGEGLMSQNGGEPYPRVAALSHASETPNGGQHGALGADYENEPAHLAIPNPGHNGGGGADSHPAFFDIFTEAHSDGPGTDAARMAAEGPLSLISHSGADDLAQIARQAAVQGFTYDTSIFANVRSEDQDPQGEPHGNGPSGAGFKSTSGMDDEPKIDALHAAHQGSEPAGLVSHVELPSALAGDANGGAFERSRGGVKRPHEPGFQSGGHEGSMDGERHAGPGAAHVGEGLMSQNGGEPYPRVAGIGGAGLQIPHHGTIDDGPSTLLDFQAHPDLDANAVVEHQFELPHHLADAGHHDTGGGHGHGHEAALDHLRDMEIDI